MPDDPTRAAREHSQVALVNFLRADLNLAFTFLATARIDAADDPKHSRALREKVRTALRSIRLLSARIENTDRWREIHSRADELEAAFAAADGPR